MTLSSDVAAIAAVAELIITLGIQPALKMNQYSLKETQLSGMGRETANFCKSVPGCIEAHRSDQRHVIILNTLIDI